MFRDIEWIPFIAGWTLIIGIPLGIAQLFKKPKPIPPPPPPPPPPPIQYKWFNLDHRTHIFNQRLKQLDLTKVAHHAFLATAEQMLKKDFVENKGQAYEFNERIGPSDDSISDDLFVAFTYLLTKLPPYKQSGNLYAKLTDLLSPQIIATFFRLVNENKRFPSTAHQAYITEDWGRALTSTGQSKTLDYFYLDKIGERGSSQHSTYLLRHYPELRECDWPVPIPETLRFEGMHIIAPQGRGKTTLLSAILKHDLTTIALGNACIIIFDSKGDLIQHVRQLRVFAPEQFLEGKLTLIEPSPELAINPLDIGATKGHTIELVEYLLIGLLESVPTNNQLLLLRKLILASLSIPDANIMTMRDILLNGWGKYEQYILKADELTAEWFKAGQFDERAMKETRQALFTKLEDLITKVDAIKGMFRATKTRVHMHELMDKPGVVVIDNSVRILADKGSELFGRFFIAQILAAAQQRAGRDQSDKLPVYVYMDEAHTVIANDPSIAKIIQTCRSQNIAMMFAHQELAQIKNDDVRGALRNCAIKMANPRNDAKELAGDFHTEEGTLRSLNKGQFMLYLADYTDCLKISVPNFPVSKWAKMSDEDFAAIRANMARRFHQEVTFPESEASYPIAAEDPPNTDPQPWKPA